MASTDVWSDFEGLRHGVKHNTVDKLKHILSGFNDECGTHFSKSGKKQDIIDRIINAIDSWRQNNAVDKWIKAKTVLCQVRNSGMYSPARIPGSSHTSMMPSSTYGSPSHLKTPTYNPSGSSSVGRFDPYAPHKPSGSLGVSGPASTSRPSDTARTTLRFKESPFFIMNEQVSSVVECPESGSHVDRKSQSVNFTLTLDQITKLRADKSRFRLRLFCTSSMFYTPNSTFRTASPPCPIEFPPTCEVRVNGVQLTASLKGLKKKPGTAPPPELDKYVRITPTPNRIEMVYVNSQQPVQPKKFYLVVYLVEATSVEQLVEDLEKNHFQSGDEIRSQMQAAITEDDDIVAGPQKMSLKCPLTLMRINTPCRSSKCVHRQCFDATSWFSVNEQTTTWLCPVCEKTLDCKDLVIDGFFESILKECPESVEDVMVEADGEWHTTDNKFGSTNWKMKHPPAQTSTSPRKPTKAPTPSRTTSAGDIKGGKGKTGVEIVFVDSDDEDEGRVKRELSPSFGDASSSVLRTQSHSSVLSPPQTQQTDAVIDLTLDSDEEDPSPPIQTGKRKAADPALSPTENIWKKSRIDAETPPNPVSVTRVNADEYSRSSHPSSLSSVSASSPTLPFASSTYRSAFASRSPGGVPQLPPINGNVGAYSPRVNGNSSSRWPG